MSLSILIGLEGLALGGCPINALDLGRTLRQRGHRVEVFAVDEDVRVSLIPYARKCGFDLAVLPRIASTTARARQVRRVADRYQADIIHVFAPWLGAAAAIAAASRVPRAALVTNWMMENVSYTPQSVPMILGTTMLQEEAKLTHRSPVWLLEPPIDLAADHPDPERGAEFRRNHGIADDEVAVVIVSRVDQHMKAESMGYAISAIKKLNLCHVRLVIVGSGNAFEQIQAQAEAANAELGRPAIVLTGALEDPRPAYAGADITLGMGGSALRALAHARPLVVLGVNGFARTFEPATTAYFYRFGFFGEDVEPDPVGHLAKEISALLPQDRRATLGAFGLAEVEGRFGLDVAAASLETMYEDSLRRVAPPPRRWAEAAVLWSRSAAHEARSAITRLARRGR